jgi:phosphate transport system protein
MREQFHGDLRQLADLLSGMSRTAARQLRLATRALLDGDLGAAEQALAEDAALDADRDRCLDYAQRLLALQAPVASDLRSIIAVIHCAERIERMGDLARHVAELSQRVHPEIVVPEHLRESFAELGRLANDMAMKLTGLIDTQDVGCFERMVQDDEEIDQAHERLMREITSAEWAHGVPSAVNLTLAGRFYERFADQVVSVARMLDFAATGKRPV